MPGFRDFERATAAVTYGEAKENKGIFDVWVPTEGLPFGISCKMSSKQPYQNRSSFMELSNSAAYFKSALDANGINWRHDPHDAGLVVVDLVSSWHTDVEDAVDLPGSRYAVLAHDNQWEWFQLHCFPLDLSIANPDTDVEWEAYSVRGGQPRSLRGYIMDGDRRHCLWQWYADSGGQLKYYPLLDWAEWSTEEFQLEPVEPVSLRQRAIDYFGNMWPASLPEAPNWPEAG